jgi:hypothetical protein
MGYIVFIMGLSGVMVVLAFAICVFILHIRIEKLEELQRKTAELLNINLEIIEILDRHNIK